MHSGLNLNAAVRKWWRRRTAQPQMMYAAPCSCYPRRRDGSACDVRMPGYEGACRGAREQRRREAERQRQMAGADYESANHPGEAPPFRVRRGRRHGTHRSVGTHCNTLSSDARACSDRPLRARSVSMVRLRAPQLRCKHHRRRHRVTGAMLRITIYRIKKHCKRPVVRIQNAFFSGAASRWRHVRPASS